MLAGTEVFGLFMFPVVSLMAAYIMAKFALPKISESGRQNHK